MTLAWWAAEVDVGGGGGGLGDWYEQGVVGTLGAALSQTVPPCLLLLLPLLLP